MFFSTIAGKGVSDLFGKSGNFSVRVQGNGVIFIGVVDMVVGGVVGDGVVVVRRVGTFGVVF